jgi:hypothetical protein
MKVVNGFAAMHVQRTEMHDFLAKVNQEFTGGLKPA